jgi:RNA polymerase sigma-70 factor, ECF subfamily
MLESDQSQETREIETADSKALAAPAAFHKAPGDMLALYSSYLKLIAQSQLDHRLHRRVSPSDIVQETLLEAHRDFGDFRGSTEVELLAWLRRILINNLIETNVKHVRSEKRDVRREVYLDQVRSSVEQSGVRLERWIKATSNTPSHEVLQREQVTRLTDALQELPPDSRQVIVLRHMEGRGFQEIAEIMNRTSGACRMVWLRAIDMLRKKLDVSDLS